MILTYDTWGKLISIEGTLKDTLGVKNPYRYRGYRYDTETALYYLNSRYYNAEWVRFVNSDSLVIGNGDLLEHNVFAYCGNNPVSREEQGGYIWNIIGGAIIGGVINGAISIGTSLAKGEKVNWKSVGVSVLSGAVSGALAGSGVGLVGQVLGNSLISGASYAADKYVNGKECTLNNVRNAAIFGGIAGAYGGRGLMNAKGAMSKAVKEFNSEYSKALVRTLSSRYGAKVIAKRAIDNVVNTGVNEIGTATGKYLLGSIGSSYATSYFEEEVKPSSQKSTSSGYSWDYYAPYRTY